MDIGLTAGQGHSQGSGSRAAGVARRAIISALIKRSCSDHAVTVALQWLGRMGRLGRLARVVAIDCRQGPAGRGAVVTIVLLSGQHSDRKKWPIRPKGGSH